MSFASMHNDYLDPDFQDEPFDNELIKEAFKDFDGPSSLARGVYKGTDCGASVGVCLVVPEIQYGMDGEPYEVMLEKWFYSGSLHELGTFQDLDEKGILIRGFCVSSIVEGCDADTSTYGVMIDHVNDSAEDISKRFWDALESVEAEAAELWDLTHGCETCEEHWESLGCAAEMIWDECPDCEGHGEIK